MIINKVNFTCITHTELKHTDLYTVFITVDCMLKNLTVGILKPCTRLCLIEQSRRKLQQMIKDKLIRQNRLDDLFNIICGNNDKIPS